MTARITLPVIRVVAKNDLCLLYGNATVHFHRADPACLYGCEVYAGQLSAGQDYSSLKPVYSICLIDGIVWPDGKKVHHAFRLTDSESSRTLAGTLDR